MRILIVRLSALGDIVHALPVLAALLEAIPDAQVDWVVDARYSGIFEYVEGLHTRLVVRATDGSARSGVAVFVQRRGVLNALRHMRRQQYDVAFDLQGLIKSAALAGLSGAKRVVGFPAARLREPQAGWFYSETARVPADAHIIAKNLSVLPVIGVHPRTVRFPLRVPASRVADEAAAAAARTSGRFALINPGAGWPNKCWPTPRFGELAARLRSELGLPSFVLWGEGEEALADTVVTHSSGAAVRLPPTTLGDVLAMAARARVMVSGDTGPLHLAAAMGTPLVGLYGPTWPSRNGPWHPRDLTVSRAEVCQCHHKRKCLRRDHACLEEVGVDEVFRAVLRRLAGVEARA
jgi:lipopolysaccharide heptosyltransferase I